MPKIHLFPLLAFLIFSIILIGVASLVIKGSPEISIENFFHGSGNIFFLKDDTEEKIAQLITNATTSQNGRWAVYIKDLNRHKTYGINAQEIFPSASLYKLAVLYTTYDALEKNQLTMDETLSESKSKLDAMQEEIQNAGNNSFPQYPETIDMPVSEALRLMITISDNYSAILLAERLNWENIDQLMEKEGFGKIRLTGQDFPTVSAKAVGDLLERIYSNKAVSANASEEMRKLLSAQTVNDRIPKYLPSDARIAHKTGDLDGLRHDAGIVYGKNSNYIFIFLSETSNPNVASDQIALLAKEIFETLENNL